MDKLSKSQKESIKQNSEITGGKKIDVNSIEYQSNSIALNGTEEEMKQLNETTERIVIDYSNLSGRETANRGEFRKRTKNHLSQTIKKLLEKQNEILEEKNYNINKFAEQDLKKISTPDIIIMFAEHKGQKKANQNQINRNLEVIKELKIIK